MNSMIYPVTSNLTAGKIKSQPLSKQKLERSIFVIGDDQFSINWAKTNALELKKIAAIGFITNVASQTRVKKIENETGLTLLPAQ